MMLYGSGRRKNENEMRTTIRRFLTHLLRENANDRLVIFPKSAAGDMVISVLQNEFQISPSGYFDTIEQLVTNMTRFDNHRILLCYYELDHYDDYRKIMSNYQEFDWVDMFPDKPLYIDDARLIAFEQAAREIACQEIQGDIAEVGVFRGYTASYLNRFFPDRLLHLFDTFEGFAECDCKTEWQNQYSSFIPGNFSDTSVEIVLEKMVNRDKCCIHKGIFPNTSKGLENHTFCFVHLDADLYEPIYAGLRFFYPRLAEGGYIFVHDVIGSVCKGARTALTQFCKEEHIGYVVMPDSIESGTAVIVKPYGK